MQYIKTFESFLNEAYTYKTVKEDENGDRRTIIAYDGKNKVGSLTIELMVNAQWYFEDEFSEDEYDKMFPNDEVFKIEHLEVNDTYKGKGIAKELMKKAIDLAKKLNYQNVYLNASPMGNKGLDLPNLVDFYKSFGFEEILDQGGNVQMLLWLNKKVNENDNFFIETNKKIAKELNIPTEGDYIRLYHGTNDSNFKKILKSNMIKVGTWLAPDYETAFKYANLACSKNQKPVVDVMYVYMGSIVYNGYFSTQRDLYRYEGNYYQPKK